MFGETTAPAELQAVRARRSSTSTRGDLLRLRDAPRAGARDDATRPGPGTCGRSSSASATRGDTAPARRALRAATTRRMRTSSRRSATRTSTPRGSGRSPRPIASALRTFSSQLRYMDDYPEYRFACSQAQQYAWIKERNPDLWERIRAKVDAGQFVPVGGSWVEPDCNLPSGESLAAPVPARPALLRAGIRPPPPRVLEPGRVRLRGTAAADPARGGHHALPDAEALVEPLHKPEHHTFVWQGDDGSEVLGALPAGRHVQQRRQTCPSC